MLAIALGVGFASALIIASLPITDPISESGANLLGVIGGGMVSAVSTAIGALVVYRGGGPGQAPDVASAPPDRPTVDPDSDIPVG